MRFYRDIDYFLYFADFPHMGVYGAAVSNTDGTANIYINTLYNSDIQDRTIRHELRHVAKGHLWDNAKTITQKELEADDASDCTFGKDFSFVDLDEPVFVDIWDAPPDGMVPEFTSLAAFRRFMLARRRRLCRSRKT